MARGSWGGGKVVWSPQETCWERNAHHHVPPWWHGKNYPPRLQRHLCGNIAEVPLMHWLVGRNVPKESPSIPASIRAGVLTCPSPCRGTFLDHRASPLLPPLLPSTPSQNTLNGCAGPTISLESIFPRIAVLQPNRICSTTICQDWTRPQSWQRHILKVSQGLEWERQLPSRAQRRGSAAPVLVA